LSLQTWHMTLYMPSPLTSFLSLLFEPKRDFPFHFTANTIFHHLSLHQLRSEKIPHYNVHLPINHLVTVMQ
jgi:hypothetical protein